MALELRVKKRFCGFGFDAWLGLDNELFVLFGPSGSGKSLMLNMISGMVRPDEGEIIIDTERVFDSGRGIDVPIRKRGVGFLFQDYALFPHMTVFENIAYGISHLDSGEVRKRVEGLIELMRLRGLEKRYPGELSGGQKQRTALARTLATGPRVLLLDEPFSALDHQVREKLRMDLINIHREFPITTIFVTHDLEEAFMMAERMAVINNGRIEHVGTREEVFYRPRTRSAAKFVGVRNIFDGCISGIEGSELIITCAGLGDIRAKADPSVDLRAGQKVSFCIRPEEIPVIRPDRGLDGRVRDNVLSGEIYSTVDRGTSHALLIKVGRGGATLKVELPNFVVRKLGLFSGGNVTVALKKESIWVIPDGEVIGPKEKSPE